MKKICIGIILLIFGINNIAFAKIYDLSQISQAKLVSEYSVDTTVDEMDTVTFGSYPQSDVSGNTKEPIEWIVLDRSENKALLLSKYILDCKDYHDENEYTSWEKCSLRYWLNNKFYNIAFNDGEKNNIILTHLNNRDASRGGSRFTSDDVIDDVINNKNRGFKWVISNDTDDNIFCLDLLEWGNYFQGLNKGDGPTHKNWPTTTLGSAFALNQSINGNPLYIGVKAHGKSGESWFDWTAPFWLRNGGTLDRVAPGAFLVDEYGLGSEYPLKPSLHKQDRGQAVFDGYSVGVRPALWVTSSKLVNNASSQNNSIKSGQSNNSTMNNGNGGGIPGLPSRESELRNDNHFYLDNNMQKNSWVYYKTYYYHVDGSGNIQKNQWIELRYVGADGRMYRGRQTPDGKWVGDDGLVVDVGSDLSKSLTIEVAEPDSWYKTQSGLWYYFENDRTTTKKGWFTDKRDNQTYYLDPQTGIMAVGWTTINGSQYYFNESHNNELNWYETGGGFYESYGKKTKAYGSMFKNETTPDGKKVDANGKLVK